MSIEIIESHTILPDLVQRGGVVIDCGANLGAFSVEMIRRFDCRCYAFEASPTVFGQMPRHSKLITRNLAICNSDRAVTFTLSNDITRNKISDTPTEDAFCTIVDGRHLGTTLGEFGIADIEVLKMDIEGAELEVIDSLDDKFFRGVRQMTIEFHDFLGYASTFEVNQRIQRLADIGFRELYWSSRRNTADVLLVNSRCLGPLRHLYEQEAVRRMRAGGRKLRRRWSIK